MIYSLDHAAQELMATGYIRRHNQEELYNFALAAREQLTEFFSVLGGQPVFDTEVEIIGLRRMSNEALQERAERLNADSPAGLFRGRALTFEHALVLWFFRKQLDSDLEKGADRTWMTLDEIVRGVAAYYPAHLKDDEAKLSRKVSSALSNFTKNNLIDVQNSSRGELWSGQPSLRVALGADEMELFTQQIIEVLEQSQKSASKHEAIDPLSPDDPASLWREAAPSEESQ